LDTVATILNLQRGDEIHVAATSWTLVGQALLHGVLILREAFE
jgi:hypothetical protein